MRHLFLYSVLLGAAGVLSAQDAVRYDLVLIETFDGIGTEYFEPEEITVEVQGATSTLSDRYSVSNLVDGDPATAWFEGAPGYGEGTTITFSADPSAVPRVIGVWPGYQRSPELYERNGRPSRIRITWTGFDPSREVSFFEIASLETNLIRTYDSRVAARPQYVYIDSGPFVQNAEVSELAFLSIEILEVDSDGSSDPDTGISEIKLYAEGRRVGVRAPGY